MEKKNLYIFFLKSKIFVLKTNLDIMNATQNETTFIIQCGYACQPLPYILSCIVFITFLFFVYTICKIFNRSVLQMFKTEHIRGLKQEYLITKNKKCCSFFFILVDIFGLRYIADNKEMILKKKRSVYKCLWLNSFFWLIFCFSYCLMIFVLFYEIDIMYALSFLGGFAIFVAVCSQTIFVPYFTGFLYILTDQIEFFKDYDLYDLNGKIVYKNIKFLGFSTREVLFKFNNKEDQEPLQMPAEHLPRFILQKIKSL